MNDVQRFEFNQLQALATDLRAAVAAMKGANEVTDLWLHALIASHPAPAKLGEQMQQLAPQLQTSDEPAQREAGLATMKSLRKALDHAHLAALNRAAVR